MWQAAGSSDESDQALVAKTQQRVDQASPLDRFSVASVELQDVHMICLQTLQAGLDVSLQDVLFPDVINLKMIVMLRVHAAAFCRQVEFVAARADVPANTLFADSIVGRGVDEVDTGIEHCVQELVRRFFAHDAHTPRPGPANSHTAVTELCHFKASPAESLCNHCRQFLQDRYLALIT